MTKSAKVERFLQIKEDLFKDSTTQVNKENCVGFYIFFMDAIEFELKFLSQDDLFYNEEMKFFFDWMSRFDINEQPEFKDEYFHQIIIKMYEKAKEEYFIP